MNDRATAFRSLFQRLVLASAMPIAGCGTTIIHVGSDAAPTDSPDATPPQDAPPTDRTEPTDRGNCARQPGPTVTCSQDFTYPCNDPPRLATGELDCNTICAGNPMGGSFASCYPSAVDASATVIQCTYCAVGRRVDDFAPAPCTGDDAVGLYFAAVAQLEAASVVAFERLARELSAYGAPTELIADARVAADDERRHARDTRALAQQRGAAVPRLPKLSSEVRSLREMAVDNATEGCVRETFGALVATWQAANARDANIARAMDVIAQDETRHGALSWSVAAWLDGVLTAEDRAAVEHARTAATEGLLAELAAPIDAALIRDAGMPDPATALSLARAMLTELPRV